MSAAAQQASGFFEIEHRCQDMWGPKQMDNNLNPMSPARIDRMNALCSSMSPPIALAGKKSLLWYRGDALSSWHVKSRGESRVRRRPDGAALGRMSVPDDHFQRFFALGAPTGPEERMHSSFSVALHAEVRIAR